MARCSPTCRRRRFTTRRRCTTGRSSRSPSSLPAELADVADPEEHLLELLADTSWVWSQYDHQLFLNTVQGPGSDATVLRLKHPATGRDTGRGLALTTDGNHRWCADDPRLGTAMVVAEAAANLACVGARPIALVNCLNFGNPEHPDVMWQLSESIDGMAEACRALDVPVVGGNVSLYNETAGRDIDPTPVVGMLGLVDNLDRRPAGARVEPGCRIGCIGPPVLDLAMHAKVLEVVRGLVADDVVVGVHDVADGGVALCVAEMAVAVGVRRRGACRVVRCATSSTRRRRGSSSRWPKPTSLQSSSGAALADVPIEWIGAGGGERIVIGESIDVAAR